LRQETTHETVSCAVGVHDQVLIDGWDVVLDLLQVLTGLADGNKDGVLTLSDDSNTGSLGVDLFPLGDGKGDILE
jgi:hypothetical protein